MSGSIAGVRQVRADAVKPGDRVLYRHSSSSYVVERVSDSRIDGHVWHHFNDDTGCSCWPANRLLDVITAEEQAKQDHVTDFYRGKAAYRKA